MVYVRPKKGTKPGPKPFPGSRRKRCDLRVPPVKPKNPSHARHSPQFKMDVLRWLINNRVAITEQAENGRPWIANITGVRASQTALTDDEREQLTRAFLKNGVVYRPPTFYEGAIAWNVPRATVVWWWKYRKRYLLPDDYERSSRLPVCEITPGSSFPEPVPEPQVLPEGRATTGNVDTQYNEDDENDEDGNDDDSDGGDGDDVLELPPPTTIDMSDVSDSEPDDDDSELPDLEAVLNEELAAEARQA
ncbi:hypothetical protein F5B17DRAFT_363810 [Nemania serpens]|nr:hypothetical protein F5B17DRAFT_363810 [Nemania serpens]